MAEKRRLREIKALIERAGLELIEVEMRGSGHLMAWVRAADGRKMPSTFPATASDHRSDLNKLAELRRFARGVEPPAPAWRKP